MCQAVFSCLFLKTEHYFNTSPRLLPSVRVPITPAVVRARFAQYYIEIYDYFILSKDLRARAYIASL